MRQRLLFAFVTLSILPLLLLAQIEFRRSHRDALDNSLSVLSLLAEAQTRRIDIEFRRLADQAGLVASRTQMRISLRDYQNDREARHLALVNRILADAMASSEGLLGIWIRDAGGAVVAQALPLRAAMPQLGSPQPPGPMETPAIFFIYDKGREPGLWVSTALRLDGERIGTLYLLADLAGLRAVLGDFDDQELLGQTLILLDGDGSGRHLLGSTNGFVRESLVSDTGLQMILDDCLDQRIVQARRLFCQPYLSYDLRPTIVTDARVLTYSDAARVRRSARDSLITTLATALLVIAVAIVLSLWIAGSIAQPAQALRAASQRLRSGDFNVRVREQGWGELRVLARDFNDMVTALRRNTARLRDEVQTRKRYESQLENLANKDDLTGLHSRRYFLDQLDAALREAGGELALLFIDLNKFKPINDTYGHEIGDVVLRIVAGRLRNLMRESDTVGRLGGDEFAALLLPTSAGEARQIAERIADTLARPMRIADDQELSVTASIGIAMGGPDIAAAELLSAADASMYEAKRSGRPVVGPRGAKEGGGAR